MSHKRSQEKPGWSGQWFPLILFVWVAGMVWAGGGGSATFVNAPVRVITAGSSANTYYMGGDFNTPALPKLAHVAYWSGVDWLPVCGGGLTGAVRAIAISPQGNRVVVGGNFNSVGGVPGTQHIAECSGGTWKALGSGLGGEVHTLLWVGSDLYAGGAFTTDGSGVPLARVGRWNGSTWSGLGGGVDGEVLALAPWQGGVVVGGAFTNTGGSTNPRLAYWNGGTWSSVGATPDGTVRALTLVGSHLAAGGDFLHMGGLAAHYVARYDGVTWSKVGKGLSGPVFALASSGITLCVGGEFVRANGSDSSSRFAVFDGFNWRGVGPGSAGMYPRKVVRAVAGCGSEGIVGGDFQNLLTVGGGTQNQTARWSFSGWEEI